LRILDEFLDIISSIEDYIKISRNSMKLIRLRIKFIDNSTLYVSEVYINRNLVKYSYYWFDANKNLIIGWDNAPHHRKVRTYPHHKHVGSKENIVESEEHDLRAVLRFIRKRILRLE